MRDELLELVFAPQPSPGRWNLTSLSRLRDYLHSAVGDAAARHGQAIQLGALELVQSVLESTVAYEVQALRRHTKVIDVVLETILHLQALPESRRALHRSSVPVGLLAAIDFMCASEITALAQDSLSVLLLLTLGQSEPLLSFIDANGVVVLLTHSDQLLGTETDWGMQSIADVVVLLGEVTSNPSHCERVVLAAGGLGKLHQVCHGGQRFPTNKSGAFMEGLAECINTPAGLSLLKLTTALGLARGVHSCMRARLAHECASPQQDMHRESLSSGQGQGLGLVFGLLRGRGDLGERCESIVIDRCHTEEPTEQLVDLLCTGMDPAFQTACLVAMRGVQVLFSRYPDPQSLKSAVPAVDRISGQLQQVAQHRDPELSSTAVELLNTLGHTVQGVDVCSLATPASLLSSHSKSPHWGTPFSPKPKNSHPSSPQSYQASPVLSPVPVRRPDSITITPTAYFSQTSSPVPRSPNSPSRVSNNTSLPASPKSAKTDGWFSTPLRKSPASNLTGSPTLRSSSPALSSPHSNPRSPGPSSPDLSSRESGAGSPATPFVAASPCGSFFSTRASSPASSVPASPQTAQISPEPEHEHLGQTSPELEDTARSWETSADSKSDDETPAFTLAVHASPETTQGMAEKVASSVVSDIHTGSDSWRKLRDHIGAGRDHRVNLEHWVSVLGALEGDEHSLVAEAARSLKELAES